MFNGSEVKMVRWEPQELGKVPDAVDGDVVFLSHKVTVDNVKHARSAEYFNFDELELQYGSGRETNDCCHDLESEDPDDVFPTGWRTLTTRRMSRSVRTSC